MSQESNNIGQAGEEISKNYLEKQGFIIIEQNFRSKRGEIDIVAKDKDILVFVEVKSYSFRSLGSPLEAISKKKKFAIIYTAKTYLYQKRIKNTNCRFDVVAIYKDRYGQQKTDHIKDAFQAC